jgi:phosphate transport system permease protein
VAGPISIGIADCSSRAGPVRVAAAALVLTSSSPAIPSIVYGLWGIFVLVPRSGRSRRRSRSRSRKLPLFRGPPLGVGMLSRRRSLAIMVIPFTLRVAREVLKRVPVASGKARTPSAPPVRGHPRRLFYGADRHRGAVMLGFGARARRDHGRDDGHREQPAGIASLFAPQHTMAAVIANEFTEGRHGPLPARA